jgi:hypothetical protein
MIPIEQSPDGGTERLDLHNAAVDDVAAAAGRCGTIHLPTGRTCQATARHGGSCDFVHAS